MSVSSCRRCQSTLRPGARFCGGCGAATEEHKSQTRAQNAASKRVESRAVMAVAAVFVLCIGGLGWLPDLILGDGVDDASFGTLDLLSFVALLVAGGVASALMGRSAARASLAGMPRAVHMAWALPMGAVACGLSMFYVDLLPGLDEAVQPEVLPLTLPIILSMVVATPIVEEWLFRGVLWQALEPLTGTLGRITATAVLFALAHGLNGGFVLELPHRFLGGLAFGWLRLRSESLLPGMAAHATWNALVLLADPSV